MVAVRVADVTPDELLQAVTDVPLRQVVVPGTRAPVAVLVHVSAVPDAPRTRSLKMTVRIVTSVSEDHPGTLARVSEVPRAPGATPRISSTVARDTGVGRKPRTERRLMMAWSTISWSFMRCLSLCCWSGSPAAERRSARPAWSDSDAACLRTAFYLRITSATPATATSMPATANKVSFSPNIR